MSKKVLSVNLTEESYNKVTDASNALGISRSILVDKIIQKHEFSEETQRLIDEISQLQNRANQIIHLTEDTKE